MSFYYKIWVDVIVKLRSRPQNAGLWKFYALSFVSMAMSLNLILFLLILSDLRVTKGIYKISFNIFPGTRIDAFISFFISYLFPFLLLNYFFIFYNDRYKKLIKQYPYNNGKLFSRYFIGSLAAIVLYFFSAVLVVQYFV